MKTFQFLLIVFLTVSVSFCQMKDQDGYTKEDVQGKIEKFRNIRTAGFVMLGMGVTAIGTGIALASTADWESHSTPTGVSTTTNDPSGGAGIICIAVGIPVTVAGIVLSSIGSKKYREYKYRINFFSSYNPNKKNIHAGIACNF